MYVVPQVATLYCMNVLDLYSDPETWALLQETEELGIPEAEKNKNDSSCNPEEYAAWNRCFLLY